MLFCSGCGMSHGSLLFSQEQLSRPDENRICIGREGVLRLCAHKAFSFDDIETMERETLASRNIRFVCRHEDHYQASWEKRWGREWGELSFPSLRVWRSRSGGDPHITIRSSLRVLRCYSDDIITREGLNNAFRAIAPTTSSWICPHLRFDHPRLTYAYSSLDCEDSGNPLYKIAFPATKNYSSFPSLIKYPRCHMGHHYRQETSCRACLTNFGLYRVPLPGDNEHEVIFHSETQLATTTPDNPRWLDHLARSSFTLSEGAKHWLWCDRPGCWTNVLDWDKWWFVT